MNKRFFKENKFLYLLFSLLLFFILNPFLVNSTKEMLVFGVLFTVVLVFSIYPLGHRRFLTIPSIVLAVLAFVSFWSTRLLKSNTTLLTTENTLTILFFALITLYVIHYVLQDRVVNLNTLCGAVCGYLLIALVWTFSYNFIYFYNHAAFSFPGQQNTSHLLQVQNFIYYSFVTQSTLGFGDITPLSTVARTFSWLQAVIGQIYLTVWIAHLVGLHVASRSHRGAKE